MAKLWSQFGKRIPPPRSLNQLLDNGMLKSSMVKTAIKLFNKTMHELKSSSDPSVSEELTHLTLVLYNHYVKANDKKQQRAILESALEALSLPQHKQFVLGILSRSAVKDGDIQAAREWLKTCDPHSDDLRSDTTYRIGQALIDTAEGNFDNVHKVLGVSQMDVPISDGYHEVSTVLRANAWEKLGQPDTARTLINAYITGGGVYGINGLKYVQGVYPHLNLCQECLS